MNHTYIPMLGHSKHQNGPANFRGTSLPRGHHSPQHQQMNRASSSCPASPMLPSAASSPRKGGLPLSRPPCASDKGSKPSLPPAVPERGDPKPKHEKLSHTRSFDLDHIYQNLCTAVKGASKPRSNSFSIPWRRKKKLQEALPGIAEEAREEGGGGGGGGSGKPQPLASPSVTSSTSNGAQQTENFDLTANLEEWRQKARWLERKRRSKDIRITGENKGIDIAILYASDGTVWKDYLHSTFTKFRNGCKDLIESVNVEELKEDVEPLQRLTLKSANLQIVILSPQFMSHIANHARSELGHVFKPKKVLCVLLNVDNSSFTPAHLSVLYSYKEWQHLTVRSEDMSSVSKVINKATSILNSSEVYSGYRDESLARFKVIPRTITSTHPRVYIIMSDEVHEEVVISVTSANKEPDIIRRWNLQNPYTISFQIPESYLETSAFLYIEVSVNGKSQGSRQVKCERNMDALSQILSNSKNPIDIMCQALNLNPLNNDLDLCLAKNFCMRTPPGRSADDDSEKGTSFFPTWVHFSAYYGLKMFTRALLEAPGAKCALSFPNCDGDTPSLLAFKSGHLALAHELETEMSCSRCRGVSSPQHIKKTGWKKTNVATYSIPPPPRPLKSNYDTLPAPRLVSPSNTPPAPSGASPESSVSVTPPPTMTPPISSPQLVEEDNNSSFFEEGCHASQQSLPSVPSALSNTDFALDPKSHSLKEVVESYLNMNVTGRHGKHEESQHFYIEVTKFIEGKKENKNDESLSEVDSSMATGDASNQEQFTTFMADQRSDDTVSESEAGATYMTATNIPNSTNRPTTNLVRHVVGLLGGRRRPLHMEGTRSLRDEPNYYIDDPTLNTQAGRTRYLKGTASDSEEEKNGRLPVANGRIAARSHEPSPVSTVGSFSPSIEFSFVRKSSLNDGAQSVRIKERPPVPAPFPVHSDDEEDNYIDPSAINTPPRYQILINKKSASKCNDVQFYKCRLDDPASRIRLKILKPHKRDEEEDEADYEDLDMK